MNFKEALQRLFEQWADQPTEFKQKYKGYKSKWLSGNGYVSEKKMEQMLIAAGFTKNEKWILKNKH